MTSTAHDDLELRDLAPAEVLSFATEQRRIADRAEARLLALAVHWVDLHPVTDDQVGVVPAGAGTPGVGEYAVEALAATLGLSYAAGLRLVSEAVELCFRLPRLWSLVQGGRLQAWKARGVAAETTRLSPEAVGFVDRHLAVVAGRNTTPTPGKLRELVHEAMLRCDPDQAAGVEQAALDARGVWFDHRASTATTDLTARLDTLDALDLEASVADLAGLLGSLGDDRSFDLRRATALGLLAHPQRALDLATGTGAGPGGGSGQEAAPVLNGSRGTLFLHVTTDDLAAGGGGRVERLGPATLDLLRDWISRFSSFTVRPGPGPGPHRHRRRPRPTRLDAADRDPARPALRVPRLRHRRPVLRPRPHRPLPSTRRRRTTGPDDSRQPRRPLPATSPAQDLHQLDLPATARRHVRVDQPVRPHAPRHRRALNHARWRAVGLTPALLAERDGVAFRHGSH
jgi:hypothetical protein